MEEMDDYTNNFTSTQVWNNGVVVSAEMDTSGDERLVILRVQGENENMLCDIEMGELEALSIISVLSSALTSVDAEIRN